MRKLVAIVTVAAVAALAAASLASAGRSAGGWSAKLDAMNEVPAQVVKDANASGTFTGTLAGKKLSWKLTFSKLTGPATAAHIHMAPAGKAGGVAVALCGPCKSGMTGVATLSSAQLAAFKKHDLYVNVHTAKNPNGEIRGQIH